VVFHLEVFHLEVFRLEAAPFLVVCDQAAWTLEAACIQEVSGAGGGHAYDRHRRAGIPNQDRGHNNCDKQW